MVCTWRTHGLLIYLFTTCAWLDHKLFMTCLWLFYELFMTFSRHFHVLLMAWSWLSSIDLFITCLYLVRNLLITFYHIISDWYIAKLSFNFNFNFLGSWDSLILNFSTHPLPYAAVRATKGQVENEFYYLRTWFGFTNILAPYYVLNLVIFKHL